MKRLLLSLILVLSSIRPAAAWTKDLINACHAVAKNDGSATAGQRMLVFTENYTVNNMGLTGDLPPNVYNACQKDFNVQNNAIFAKINAEVPGANITKQPSTKPQQSGADTDSFANLNKPSGMRNLKDRYNAEVEAGAVKARIKSPGSGETDYARNSDVDIMPNVKNPNVNAQNFNALNAHNTGTLYDDYYAALYELESRENGVPSIKNSGHYVNEMRGQIAAKVTEMKAHVKALGIIAKNPRVKDPTSKEYATYKNLSAKVHRANAHIAKYIERISGKKDASGKPIGCTQAIADHHGLPGPKGSDLPKIGANRVPGNYNDAAKVGALANNLTKRGIMDYSEMVAKVAKGDPAAAGEVAAAIAKGASGLTDSAKNELIDNLEKKFGKDFAKKVVGEMKTLNKGDPAVTADTKPPTFKGKPVVASKPSGGLFKDGSLTLTQGGSLQLTSTKGMATGRSILGKGGNILVGLQIYDMIKDYWEHGDLTKTGMDAGTMAVFMAGSKYLMGRLATYAPISMLAVGTYMVSKGLTEQILNRTETGQAINKAATEGFSEPAEIYDDWKDLFNPLNLLPGMPKPDALNTKEMNAYAAKIQTLIGMIKSGEYEPKHGRTIGEAIHALNYLPMSKVLARKPPPKPEPPAEPVVPQFDQEAYEAAYFDAIKKGLIKSGDKDKFSYAYDPRTKRMDPAKAKEFDEKSAAVPVDPVDEPPDQAGAVDVVRIEDGSSSVSNLWDKYLNDPRLVYTRGDSGEKVPLGLSLPQPHIGAVTVDNPRTRFPNDHWSSAQYFNGKPHGLWIMRYPDGRVCYVAHYRDGHLVHSRKYHPNGRLENYSNHEYDADGVTWRRTTNKSYDDKGRLHGEGETERGADQYNVWAKSTSYNHKDGTSHKTEGPGKRSAFRVQDSLPELPTKLVPFDEVEPYLAKLANLPRPPPPSDPPPLKDLLAQGETGEWLSRAGATGAEVEAPKSTYEQKLRDALAAKKALVATGSVPKSSYEQRLQAALEAKKKAETVNAGGAVPAGVPSYQERIQEALREKKAGTQVPADRTTVERTRAPKVPPPGVTGAQTQPRKVPAANPLDGTYRGNATHRFVLNDPALRAALSKRGVSVDSTETVAFTATVSGRSVTFTSGGGTPVKGTVTGNRFNFRHSTGQATGTLSGTIANGRLSGKGEARTNDGRGIVHTTLSGVRAQ